MRMEAGKREARIMNGSLVETSSNSVHLGGLMDSLKTV